MPSSEIANRINILQSVYREIPLRQKQVTLIYKTGASMKFDLYNDNFHKAKVGSYSR